MRARHPNGGISKGTKRSVRRDSWDLIEEKDSKKGSISCACFFHPFQDFILAFAVLIFMNIRVPIRYKITEH